MTAPMTHPYRTFLAALQQACPGLSIRMDVGMAAHTTLRLGGPADLFAEPASPREVEALLCLSTLHRIPTTIIGRGSNLLVKDGGIRGLVILIGDAMSAIQVDHREPLVLHVQGGRALQSLAQYACRHGLAGLAFAGGIPGTVGGGVFMNAGAYGGTIDSVVVSVKGYDLAGRPFQWGKRDMGFGYRSSRLQTTPGVITEVTFRFTQGDAAALMEEMIRLNKCRAEKQPLDKASAGSTFRRPQKKDCYVGTMIEANGLKGYAIGGASVSMKHAGFLINEGGTAADFQALIRHVQQVILESEGIQLEPEVRILGEDALSQPTLNEDAPTTQAASL